MSIRRAKIHSRALAAALLFFFLGIPTAMATLTRAHCQALLHSPNATPINLEVSELHNEKLEALDRLVPGKTLVVQSIEPHLGARVLRTILTRVEKDEVIASFYYEISAFAPTVFIVGDMDTHPDYRGRGLYRLLFSTALALEPQVSVLLTTLRGDNYSAFERAIIEQRYRPGEDVPAEVQLKAVRNTPAFRLRKELGFSTIVSYEPFWKERLLTLIVTRDRAP